MHRKGLSRFAVVATLAVSLVAIAALALPLTPPGAHALRSLASVAGSRIFPWAPVTALADNGCVPSTSGGGTTPPSTSGGGTTPPSTSGGGTCPSPTVVVNASASAVCQGGSVTLTATASGGSPPYTFSWSPPVGLSSTTSATVAASPAATTTYTVTVTDSTGATAAASTTVTVNPLPSVSISGAPSGAVIVGTPVSLTGAASGGTSPYSFAWTKGGSPFGSTAAITDTPGLGNTTYAVTVNDAHGCTATASAGLHVYNFALSLTPASQTVTVGGGPASYAVSSTLLPGSTAVGLPASVGLAISGLPGTITPTMPSTVALPGSVSLSLAIGATPPGDYPFTVTGSVAGGTRTAPGDLTIAYNICVLYDQTQVKKLGSTIPIKLQLCDAAGNDVSSSTIVVHALAVQMLSPTVPPVVPDDSGSANPDNDFRFDGSLGTTGGYIFNLSTKGLAAGAWEMIFTAGGDPTSHLVLFSLK